MERLFKRPCNAPFNALLKAELPELIRPKVGQVVAHQGSGCELNRLPAAEDDWNGRSHVVDVLEEGFAFEGRLHKSLTAIARQITGAHWSGPRFFGI